MALEELSASLTRRGEELQSDVVRIAEGQTRTIWGVNDAAILDAEHVEL